MQKKRNIFQTTQQLSTKPEHFHVYHGNVPVNNFFVHRNPAPNYFYPHIGTFCLGLSQIAMKFSENDYYTKNKELYGDWRSWAKCYLFFVSHENFIF